MRGAGSIESETIHIPVGSARKVSGLVLEPPQARACCVLAHGAGAGMTHPFMQAVAEGLAARSIATLRFQFPYMEQGLKRPDPPEVAHLTIRAAIEQAARCLPHLAVFAGGKSFGGRMASQAQAESGMPGVQGLVFLGFPLHPAGRPSTQRAEHLSKVHVPMLFLQGTRDALAKPELLDSVVRKLGTLVRLKLFTDADHSFHVPARYERSDEEILGSLCEATADWILSVLRVAKRRKI